MNVANEFCVECHGQLGVTVEGVRYCSNPDCRRWGVLTVAYEKDGLAMLVGQAPLPHPSLGTKPPKYKYARSSGA